MKTRILWLSPNLNHYKARFLELLANEEDIDLCVFSGSGREKMGDQELVNDWSFRQINVDVLKKDFGKSNIVKTKLKAIFKEFDWVMIPAEKKNMPLFLYLLKLRGFNNNVKLYSYNHPVLKSGNGKSNRLDIWVTKFYFKLLDRVVFYTEHSHKWAIKNKFIQSKKAFWANNTVDTNEIKKYYSYQLPPVDNLSLLFIGRMIPSKRIPDLLKYYNALKERIPNLKLEVIGDGPENHLISLAATSDSNITWHGTLIDEEVIAPIMSRTSLVFIPGHSGLSVNHAFAYGRAYVTLQGPSHAPELDYLTHGENGYILENDFESNVEKMSQLLTNREDLERFSLNAKQKGEYLSVEKWVQQMKQSLING